MKSIKISLVAIMAGALALVLILGASMGSAAPPTPELTGDLVFMGNGGTGGNNVKVLDVDAMAVVNTIGGGGYLASNHGVLLSGNTLWNTNAALVSYKPKVVKLDLGTLTQSYFEVTGNGGNFNSGLCGIEFALNNPSNNIWVTSMSNTAGGGGGIYEVNQTTGETGSYIDVSSGADNAATCGIGWNTAGTTAYASLMPAKKVTTMSWPGGVIGTSTAVTGTGSLHILDVAKSAGYAYVTGGNVTGVGKIAIWDIAANLQVATVTVPSGPTADDMHGPTVAHGEGFLYVHSRGGSSGTYPGTTYIYDIGGDTSVPDAGGTKTAPVLIGQIADQGTTSPSCGTDVGTKSDYCGQPALSLSKNGIAYWASQADYDNGVLSANYTITNGSSFGAHSVAIAGTVDTNGVTFNSATGGGNIAGGGSAGVTVKYNVPGGVGSFMSTVYATAKDLCNNSYAYPGPMA